MYKLFVPLQRLSFSMKKNLSKITIKFFLNRNLAPMQQHGKLFYPLYILVTFKRKSTQFKSKSDQYFEDIDNLKKDRPDILQFEERILRKMIEYEIENLGEDKFTLKGVSERYPYYATSIYIALETYLKDKLQKQMFSGGDPLAMVPNYENPAVTVPLLYTAAVRLFPGFENKMPAQLIEELQAYEHYQTLFPLEFFMYDFAVIIEWLNGDHEKVLTEAFTKVYGNKAADLNRIVALLNKATAER